MNAESLKSELQQVLENDLALRKEFNELKRSLSDYRNQLILRDEDCKRLQVTIDVLNTKLVVMERDNTNYKAELTSFKELRGTIREQLQAKQDEIDARLAEIQSLRDDLNAVAVSYEEKLTLLSTESQEELRRVRENYEAQITELKSGAYYKENGLRQDFENRLAELNMHWAEKEQDLILSHEDNVMRLRESHAREISLLTENFTSQLTGLAEAGQNELAGVKGEYEARLTELQALLDSATNDSEARYGAEITSLRQSLEQQRDAMQQSFDDQMSAMRTSHETEISDLTAGYEAKIAELTTMLESSSVDITSRYEQRLSELQTLHETTLAEKLSGHEAQLAAIVNEYEEKLSYTLIHSNSQNTKLGEELSRAQQECELAHDGLRKATETISSGEAERAEILRQLCEVQSNLSGEQQRFAELTAEFEAYRQQASLSEGEKIESLNAQIVHLNQAHSSYVAELNTVIDDLRLEVANMTSVFETMTNNLADAENAISAGRLNGSELETRLAELVAEAEARKAEDAAFIETLRSETETRLAEKDIAFNKLLAENEGLISEIEGAQSKIESQEAEIVLLRSELEELTRVSQEKSSDFRETISERNFRVTNLEAENAGMKVELSFLRDENASLKNLVREGETIAENASKLTVQLAELAGEKSSLETITGDLQRMVGSMNDQLASMSGRISQYEQEIEALKNASPDPSQEEYISRLFAQIDALNDEKMALLTEKEEMANQLMRMNSVIEKISQQVDTEEIDVTNLNNHRKNVILGGNSSEAGDRQTMKKQINELVREIDKCISLLSA